MIQTDGMPNPRCGSLASRGLPLCVFDPATTQLFEPTPCSPARPPPMSKPAIVLIELPRWARSASAMASVADSADGDVPGDAPGCPEPEPEPEPGFPDAGPAPPSPIAVVAVMTGIAGSYGGKSSSVFFGSPSRASASSRKISESTLPPSDHAWTFCQVAVSSGVHGSSEYPPMPPRPDLSPANT